MQVNLTTKQETEMRRMRQWFPYRIVYAAINLQTEEFVCSAVTTMRIPNKLAREGWQVFTLEAGK